MFLIFYQIDGSKLKPLESHVDDLILKYSKFSSLM